MAWLLAGLICIAGAVFVLRWFITAEPWQIMRALRWTGLAIAVVIAVFVLLTGRFQLLIATAALLFPWIARMRAFRRAAKAARGPTEGQTSQVHTRFVTMELNHDTGEMDGTVQEGPYAGKLLSGLALDQVLEIYRTALSADSQSAQVLQAYLDRMHGDTWHERMGGAHSGAEGPQDGARPAGPMTVHEARQILGVSRDASPDEIKQAHRRLMRQYHPDRGGSDYLAARINEAKEVLLGER